MHLQDDFFPIPNHLDLLSENGWITESLLHNCHWCSNLASSNGEDEQDGKESVWLLELTLGHSEKIGGRKLCKLSLIQ